VLQAKKLLCSARKVVYNMS